MNSRKIPLWSVVAFLLLAQGILLVLIFESPKTATTQTKLQQLSNELKSAADSIAQIEQEVKQTEQLVNDLEEKKTLYERLIETDREQVEAIALLLTQQQEKENRRTFWLNIASGFVINLITAIMATFAEYRWGFFRRWLGTQDQSPSN